MAGGVVDGSGANSHYRYGGLWKNLKKSSAAPPVGTAAGEQGGVAAAAAEGQSSSEDESAAVLLGGLELGVDRVDGPAVEEEGGRAFAAVP